MGKCFALRIPITSDSQIAWVNVTLKNPPEFIEEPNDDWGFNWEIQQGSLFIDALDDGNPEHLAVFLRLMMRYSHFNFMSLGFEFCSTRSKIRPDGFEGGAFRIRKHDGKIEEEWINTTEFLKEWGIA